MPAAIICLADMDFDAPPAEVRPKLMRDIAKPRAV